MTRVAELATAITHAERRIRPYVLETPAEPSPALGEKIGAQVIAKLENLQHTGSFKVRGALNKLLLLPPEERERGVVAASTGNHGAAVAYALSRLGGRGIVFVPESAPPSKLAAIERAGMEIRRVAGDPVEAERRARAFSEESGRAYMSPYNDLDVVAGQGTIGVELLRQAGPIDALVASVGGGGLIAGIAAALRAAKEPDDPRTEIIGCAPERSPVMFRSLEAGEIVEVATQPTLSDGTAGGLEAGAVTFDLCRELIDHHLTVGEAEIATALAAFIDDRHMLVEGAAAVALAAIGKLGDRLAGKRVVVVLCGANIGSATLRRALELAGGGQSP